MRTVSICLALAALALAGAPGCEGAKNHFAYFTPDFHPGPHPRVVVGQINNQAAKPAPADLAADFDPIAELRARLDSALDRRGLKGSPADPHVIVLLPAIQDYVPGNAFVRWLAPGAAGQTVLTVYCQVRQDAKDAGTIKVRRTVEVGGVYSVGQWQAIFGAIADDLVDELRAKLSP